MFKKVEMLSKVDHLDLMIDEIKDFSFAKELRYAPLGLSEITKVSSRLPVLISGGEDNQFVGLMAVGSGSNYFIDWKPGHATYVPMFLRGYPFLMIDAKEEGNDKKLRAIGVDVESDYVGKSKAHKIFEKENLPSDFAQIKLRLIQNLEKDRINASKLLSELKKNNLLDKRSFDVKLENGETKSIISDFFVVNKERLYALSDEMLLDWLKKGWMYILETHINSIPQIEVLLSKTLVKKEA